MSVAELYASLESDAKRSEISWSPDMEAAHAALAALDEQPDATANALKGWLLRNQPCVFGGMAAAQDRLGVCVLTHADFQKSDDALKTKIQAARIAWRQKAAEGRQSGFIVAAVSERLWTASPNGALMQFAQRLASLLLLRDAGVDRIELEDVCLRLPGTRGAILHWRAGVNVFAAAGDRRWWHDHRIPGGVAFSVNSVGHLAKASRIAGALRDLSSELGIDLDRASPSKIDSLGDALRIAMQTIDNAATVRGRRATRLCPRPEGSSDAALGGKPIDLKQFAKFDPRRYEGDYHTDFTIPSPYFTPALERPDQTVFDLDFTYLWSPTEGGFDHSTMGEGVPIADTEPTSTQSRPDDALQARLRIVHEEEVSEEFLQRYLAGD